SSIYGRGSQSCSAQLVRAADFFHEHQIERIDLMKVNTEGGEYELLEHLLNASLITKIGNLQVQFHHCVPDALERMQAIQHQLERTHRLTYQYPFVWENWRIKSRE